MGEVFAECTYVGWEPATVKLLQKDAKTRSRRAAYSFPITQLHNEQYLSHVSSAKMIDPYTWPDSVAPSRDDSPVPLRPLPIV